MPEDFLCPLSLGLPSDLTFQVLRSGASLERYIGSVRPIRREAAYTPWQEYAFQFVERTSEWILQE